MPPAPPLDDPEMVVALENVLDGQLKLHRAVPRHDAYVVEDPTLITVHLLLARLQGIAPAAPPSRCARLILAQERS